MTRFLGIATACLGLLFAGSPEADAQTSIETKANAPVELEARPAPEGPAPAAAANVAGTPFSGSISPETWKSLQTFGLFALISLGPIAVLMLTSFVRINIVLLLLRQALGSPQIPGNQVLGALALLLTILVMRPIGEQVHQQAIEPFATGKLSPAEAWDVGTKPIKRFMVDQIVRTHHEHYLTDLYDYAEPPSARRVEPTYGDEYPFHVIAAAFLLSEITTALVIGFMIYLPFLVADLVIAAVLSAMGLVMMPPALVAMPLKLILFVLADGWFLVAGRLLDTFSVVRNT
ncbi:MAG: flagellar type III secretion system pore protein FliP [Isosphaeraceae bacterium]|nr:flagellar type III secretion system pore protein FliP [Isosphaeraceae bacterium]